MRASWVTTNSTRPSASATSRISSITRWPVFSSSALVGHTVTYMDENGAKLTGVISAAKLNGDSEPILRVGNTDVLLSKVTEVHTTAPTDDTAS